MQALDVRSGRDAGAELRERSPGQLLAAEFLQTGEVASPALAAPASFVDFQSADESRLIQFHGYQDRDLAVEASEVIDALLPAGDGKTLLRPLDNSSAVPGDQLFPVVVVRVEYKAVVRFDQRGVKDRKSGQIHSAFSSLRMRMMSATVSSSAKRASGILTP